MKTFIITNTFFLLYLLPVTSWAQFFTISGYINDSSNGKALENVSIFDSNSGIGTITNHDGFYKLMLNDKQVKLKITNTGFKPVVKEMEIVSDTTFVINLEPKFCDKKNLKRSQELQAVIAPDKKQANKQKPDFE